MSNSMSIFKLELTCSRQTGPGIQQRSIDSLVVWSAALSPEEGLKLVNRVTDLAREILPGALAPISESGARALEALGKDKQLELPVDANPINPTEPEASRR